MKKNANIAVQDSSSVVSTARDRRSSVVPSPMTNPISSGTVGEVSSMTGFARLAIEVSDRLSYVLTLKSVNHRFLDLQLRLPSGYDSLEIELRRMLKDRLVRGHVELALLIDRTALTQAKRGFFNREVVAQYVEAFRLAAYEFGLQGKPDLNVILRMPGALQSETQICEEDSGVLAASVLDNAPQLIDSLKSMRQIEGEALAAVLYATLERLSEVVAGVAEMRPQIEARYIERLTDRLQAAVGDLDINRQRLLEEVALLVERSDVSEEIARMETHIQHFENVLHSGGEVGKKLDFLLQEMNREANTLLSKTAGVSGKGTIITELGLIMKTEIEKAREQIQNIE